MSVLLDETEGQRRFRTLISNTARRREELLDSADGLSLEPQLGKLAIIVSGATDTNKGKVAPEKHYRAFVEEAERLKQKKEELGEYDEVFIRPRAVVDEITRDFGDPEIAGIVLIGHGSISRIWTDAGGKDFGWLAAANATSHLKQGKIEQGMCGHAPASGYSVPLGTFTVSKLSNVYAATGNIIPIPNGEDRDHLFGPVFNDSDDVMNQLDTLNLLWRGVRDGVPNRLSDS